MIENKKKFIKLIQEIKMACDNNCSSCKDKCEKKDFRVPLKEGSKVKKVIGVISGKGGVGKSLVTSMMAARVQKDGYRAAVLDADITGPSIPTAFGVGQEKATSGSRSKADGTLDEFIKPVVSAKGVQLMSMNFLLTNETDPVIWRGPVIAGAVKQFWTDVMWDDVDFMFVDCPPGTGDVPLTVFQSLPIDGIIIVSSPQQLVRVIVEKAVNMANIMKIPVLGLVENMSYVKCPDCSKEIKIFGESNIDNIAKDFDLKVLARLPISREISVSIDNGEVEELNLTELDECANTVESLLSK